MTRDLRSDPRRVIIYCRISADREGQRFGVERQEAECRRLAAKRGWTIVRVYIENDMSAYSGKPRPKYQAMLEDLRTGYADAVIALAPTRLYRRIGDALDFLDLITEQDVAVETCKAGLYRLDSADGRRDARRAAVDNQYESELMGERVRDAKEQTLRAGGYRGGPRPFGFEADGVTIREEEAQHVRAATRAVLAGQSLRSIAAGLAAAGVRTVPRRKQQPDGTRGEEVSHQWSPAELRKLLLRPRNAGLIDHKGKVEGKAVWLPLVDEEEWRACVAKLTDPARKTTTGPARKWLGSGIYKCGVCHGPAKTSSTGLRGRAEDGSGTFVAGYKCRQAGDAGGVHVTRLAANVDEYVERLAIERLSRPDARELLLPPASNGGPQEDLAATANTLRAKLDSIAEDYGKDRMTRKQMLDATEFTRKRLERIEQQMAAAATTSILATLPLGTPEIEQLWPGYHLDKKRAIIDALMTVTLLPARRGRPKGYKPDPAGKRGTYFDEESVDVDWKTPAAN